MTEPIPGRAMVIVGGDDIHHDLISAAPTFQTMGLDAGFVTRRAAGLQRFIDPKPVTAETSVFLFYTSGARFSGDQQQAFNDRIRAGGGLVAIHCANVLGTLADGTLDPADRPYHEVLGNRYLSHGPGRHEGRHTIEVVAQHPVTAGVDDFDLWDEYYEFEFADEDHQILAQRRRADGQIIPVLYAREFGAGRVVYLALGHDMRAWGEPSFKSLVRQALTWVGETRP